LEATLDKLTSPLATRLGRPRLTTRGRKLIVSAVVTAALFVALPGTAAAQASSPSSAQYDSQVKAAQQSTHQAEATDPRNRVIGALPFTGVDLVLLGIVALALVSTGIAVQRLSGTASSNERS
jgi:hypothetical protein